MLNNLKRRALTLLLSLAMIITYMPVSLMTAYAAVGQPPAHAKTQTPNNDGTYKLELSVTGEADSTKPAAHVNVLVVYDTSYSMVQYNTDGTNAQQGGTKPYRADAAENILRNFAQDLFRHQDPNDRDNIEMALVTFASNARTEVNWTNNVNTFTANLSGNGTHRSAHRQWYGNGNWGWGNGNYNGGYTNWQAAMTQAQQVINALDDDDPTYVIFITDGAPTVTNSTSYNTRHQENYNPARRLAQLIQNNDQVEELYGIYAYGNEANFLDDLIYYAHNGADRPNISGGTDPTPGYYNGGSTEELEAAIAEIFDVVVTTLGITDVAINDGTTSDVRTSTGDLAHLLEVDTSSYQYWLSIPIVNNSFTRVDRQSGETVTYNVRNNGNGTVTVTWPGNSVTVNGTVSSGTFKYEWTEANALYNVAPPAAVLNNSSVDWDLTSIGTLLDKVTYSVTFDVYPSQETYDMIADLKNSDDPEAAYNALDSKIKDYLKPVEGSNYQDYTLATNTNAVLNWRDTREGGGQGPTTYDNPKPVPTVSSTMDVTKEWDPVDDAVDIDLTVTKDGENYEDIQLTKANNWSTNINISTGLMRVKYAADDTTITDVQVLDTGHDYAFTEMDDSSYDWDLNAQIVRPMLIDSATDISTLVLIESPTEAARIKAAMGTKNYLQEGDETYFLIESNVYYLSHSAETGHLTASNVKRSHLFLYKDVVGEEPEGKTGEFTFTATVNAAYSEHYVDVEPGSASGTYTYKNVDGINVTIVRDSVSGMDMAKYTSAEGKTIVLYGTVTNGKFAYKEAMWFSMWDYTTSSLVTGLAPAGWTAEEKEGAPTGYYYAPVNTPLTVTMTKNNNIRFGNVPKNTTYTFVETDMSEGYSYVKAEQTDTTGTVTDSSRTVKGTVTKSNEDFEVTYTNQYNPALFVPQVTKKVEGRDAIEAFSFSVDYDKNDADTAAAFTAGDFEMPGAKTATTSATMEDGDTETLSFGNIIFKKAGTYKFIVKETTTTDVAGWTYDNSEKTITVTVTRNEQTGKLTAEATGNNPTVINSFTMVPDTAQIPIRKVLSYPADAKNVPDITEKYTFTLYADNDENDEGVVSPMPPAAGTVVKNPRRDGGDMMFGEIEFTEPGTYHYIVKEEGTVDDVINGNTELKTSVTVVLGDDGHLVATPASTEDDPLTFTNTYREVSATINVSKVLDVEEGVTTAPDITGKFHFKLEAVEPTDAPMPSVTEQDNASATGGEMKFGPIIYKTPGTYKYKITETNVGKPLPGVFNDNETVKYVTVVVSEKEATVTVEDDQDDSGDSDNTENAEDPGTTRKAAEPAEDKKPAEPAEPETETKLVTETVTKTVEKEVPVLDEEGNPVLDEEGNPVTEIVEEEVTEEVTKEVVVEKEPEAVEAEQEEAEPEDAEPAKEEKAEDADKAPTRAASDAKAAADPDYPPELEVTVDPEQVVFTNVYRETTAQIPVEKILAALEGVEKPDITGKYTFTLASVSGPEGVTVPMPGTTSYTNPDPTGGEMVFGTMTYNVEGTYTYTVTESRTPDVDPIEGIVDDKTASKTVTVEVSYDSKTQKLTATVSPEDAITFTNTYTPVTTEVEGTKTFADDSYEGLGVTSVVVKLIGEVINEAGEVVQEVVTETLEVAVGEDGTAEYKFEDLPKYLADGVTEISYRIEEIAVYALQDDGTKKDVTSYYTDEVDGYNITNRRDKGYLRITKAIGEDSDLELADFPDGATFTITGPEDYGTDGTKTVTGKQIKDANGSITEEVPTGTYTVTESGAEVPGYDLDTSYDPEDEDQAKVEVTTDDTEESPAEMTVTNTYTKKKYTVTVTKSFTGLPEGVLPEGFTITPKLDGEAQTDLTLTDEAKQSDGSYKWTIENVPFGTKVEAAEDNTTVPGYTLGTPTLPSPITVDISGTQTLAFVNPYSNTEYTATKIWDDNSNQDGKRPASIQLQLKQNGKDYGNPVEVGLDDEGNPLPGTKVSEDGNSWSYTWTPLETKTADGADAVYTFEEIVGEDGKLDGLDDAKYTVSYSEDGKTVTNSYTPETTDLTPKKVWNDETDKDKVRPESVTFGLYKTVGTSTTLVPVKDANDRNITVTISKPSGATVNEWTGPTLTDLPKYESGEAVKYYFRELNGETVIDEGGTLPGLPDSEGNATKYTVKYSADGMTVTNSRQSKPVKDVFETMTSTTSIDGETVQPGQQLVYKITYTNTTGEDVTATITDKIPQYTEFVSAEDGGTESGGVVTWADIDVADGASVTVAFTVKVKDDVTGETIVNDAKVKEGENEYTTNEVVNHTPPKKDVFETTTSTTSIDGETVQPGQELVYKITYTNTTGEAVKATITDKIPQYTEFVSASDGGTESGGTVTWKDIDVADKASVTVTLIVKVSEDVTGETIFNDAKVKEGENEYDTNEVFNNTPPKKDVFETLESTTSIDGETVQPGQQLVYKITYKNTTGEAVKATITDKIPQYTEFVSAEDGGTESGGTVTWSDIDVANGASVTVAFTVKVKDDVTGETIVNDAKVKAGENEFTTNEVVNHTPPKKDVFETPTSTTSIDGETVQPGQELVYKITYTNTTGEAVKATIVDTIPKYTEFVSASDGGTNSGGTVTWTDIDVADKASVTVTLTVKVSEDVSGETIVNDAIVREGENEYTTNEVFNDTPPKKDVFETLTSTTSIDGEVVQPGQELVYKITYTNTTGEPVIATITDKIPQYTEFATAQAGGVYADGAVTWTGIHVADGASVTVSFTVKVSEDVTGETIVNDAKVKAGENEYTTNEVVNHTPPKKDVFETATSTTSIDGKPVQPGQELVYKITYTNTTGEDVKATITDKIPQYTEFVSASDGGTESGGTVTWADIEVADGDSVTVTLTVKVSEDVTGETIFNDAKVKEGENEYTTNEVFNNTPPKKDVFETMTSTTSIDGETVQPGQQLVYKITYKNTTGEAVKATITDKIPQYTEFVSAEDGGTESGGTVTWKDIDVANGASVTVAFTVKVSEDVTGETIFNDAKVREGENEFTTNEVVNHTPPKKDVFETATSTTSIDGKPVQPGQELVYKITYTNTTGEDVKATITDKIPQYTEFVSASDGGAESGGTVTWADIAVENGKSVTVTLTVKVSEDVTGETIFNDAKVKEGENEYTTNEVFNNTPPKKDVFETMTSTTSIDGEVVQPGQELVYKITYKNTTGEAVKATITDKIPQYTEFVSAEDGGVNDNGVVTWTDIDVANGASVTVAFTVKVSEDVTGETIFNDAKVKAGENEFTTNEVSNHTPPKKDVFETLTSTTSIDGQTVQPGQELVYKITYTNTTGEPVIATITDKIPQYTEFATAQAGGVYADGAVTWTGIRVADGASVTVSFTVKVSEDVSGETIVNDAKVKEGENEYTTNEVTNHTPPKKDVFETATSTTSIDGQVVQPGQELVYKITYTNTSGEAVKATITDKIPQYTEFVSASDGGTESGGTVTWTDIDVADKASVTVTLTVKVSEDVTGETIFNDATLREGENEYTTNEVFNNTPPKKDVFETMTSTTSIDGETVQPGQQLVYKITYKNTTGEAVKATITDKIPQYTEFVSAEDGGTESGGTVTWKDIDVANGESVTVAFTVKVSKDVTGEIVVNDAKVKAGENEFTTNEVSNPTPPKKTVFTGGVEVDIDGQKVKPGQELQYNIKYSNSTGEDVIVDITDKIPEYTTFKSASDGGTNSGGTITWSGISVPAGGSVTVNFTVTVNDEVSGQDITNKAIVKKGENEYETNEVVNPTPRQLILRKNLPDYVDHQAELDEGAYNNATFVFEITGDYVDENGVAKKYRNTIGMDFNRPSDIDQTVVVQGIPRDITNIEVAETYGGSYDPEEVKPVVTLDEETGMFEVSFKNTKSDIEYKGGVVNNYDREGFNGTEHKGDKVPGVVGE